MDSSWKPATDSRVHLEVPESVPAEPPREVIRLYPPEPVRTPPPAPSRPGVTEERERAPGVKEERERLQSLPVGIPQFAQVRDRVASGLKPFLDGGLDWLQANGFRTVLHVLAPGEDDSADRREVEKRGMKYLRLEVSPQTLSAAVVDQFNQITTDTAGYPLFVYDKDGMLAGGLWYLHFRTVERISSEAARTKAAQHGLKEETGDHRAMWLAIQEYLRTYKG